MAPVKVFGQAMSPNVARVLVFLEEAGADYELVDVDFQAKEHKSPDHLARNPFGQIPAFQDGDLVLFESRAVAKYVARKYKTDEADLLRDGDHSEAAMVDVWTEVEAHTYSAALSPIVYECLIFPLMHGKPTDKKVVDESLGKLRKVLEVYEERLSKHRYLAGDFLSFADLNHFPYTFYFMATPHGALFESYPRVKAWWESIMSRPAIQKLSATMTP
ncbi:unnamed protein product [Triticum aestivum]|uniref:glutathione transferase n=1 Tax=Triticum aestivum TaxID=4565 RepID=A0A7H4LAY9_WHEAT|nr:unnamed protein product [Triticum aestivum]